MYIQMGNNSIIQNDEIIGIFTINTRNKWYEDLKNAQEQKLKLVDLCKNGNYASCVVTNECIYLTGIAANTLKKRAESKFWLKNINEKSY